MARPEKVAAVDEIRTKLTESDAAVLTEYRGLTVPELAELRGALRPAGTEYKVFKNTLARLAVEAAGLTELLPMLNGPTAIAFVRGDAVVAAKALRDFGKANPALIIKGGLLGPRVLTPGEVESLADIEPRDVLLARLAGGFQAPLVKAAGLFQAFTRNFAYGIKAYVDQRVEGGEALEAPAPDEAPAAEAPAAEAPEAEAPAAEAPETDTDTDTESDAEQATVDGVAPAAASDAEEKEN
ncbi:MAG: 50S ribosomal protein L10 [Acidimicrobiia bacterium]|nr:50S ribosomal protein L10 [Acidimicrobiia bacterium]